MFNQGFAGVYLRIAKRVRIFLIFLSQLIEPLVITLSSDNGTCEDKAWNTTVTMNIKPDARLQPEKKEIIATKYEIESGRFSYIYAANVMDI